MAALFYTSWLTLAALSCARGIVAPEGSNLLRRSNIVERARNPSASASVALEKDAVSDGAAMGWGFFTWPTLFILGTQNAATASLRSLLGMHPLICPGRRMNEAPIEKDLHYFDSGPLSTRPLGQRRYKSHFWSPKCREAGGRFMDATPSYLGDPKAPELLYEEITESFRQKLKFIVVLREPVDRDVSFFNHMRQPNNVWNNPYKTYTDYEREQLSAIEAKHENWMSVGFYDEQLQGWYQKFNSSQFFIVNFRDLTRNTSDVIPRVLRFLGLAEAPLKGVLLPHGDQKQHSKKVRLEDIDCATRAKAEDLYKPHNEKLYAMLRQQLASGQAAAQQGPFSAFENPTCSH